MGSITTKLQKHQNKIHEEMNEAKNMIQENFDKIDSQKCMSVNVDTNESIELKEEMSKYFMAKRKTDEGPMLQILERLSQNNTQKSAIYNILHESKEMEDKIREFENL
ncbi:hypothetical protein MXB_3419 [Myxobolus squamalis]|nr:hypothetical protein MXB_3419 [Myxobolus squamalis]